MVSNSFVLCMKRAAILTALLGSASPAASFFSPPLSKTVVASSSLSAATPSAGGVDSPRPIVSLAKGFATAALAFAVATVGDPLQASAASPAAASVSIPGGGLPSAVRVDARGLPGVGGIVSGTYGKVGPVGDVSKPGSVSVFAPKDLLGAVRAASKGHLEVDVDGVVATHLDVDVSANEAGVATIKVASPLIPKLAFKNSAAEGSGKAEVFAGKESEWYRVVNMGNGDVSYWNKKTDAALYEEPTNI